MNLHDKVGNLTDDGKDYQYVYDVWGRLRQIKNRTSPNALVAEYRYNGLGFRTGWHYDVDADGTVESSTDDPWYYFLYDDQWRSVATYADTNPTDPAPLWADWNVDGVVDLSDFFGFLNDQDADDDIIPAWVSISQAVRCLEESTKPLPQSARIRLQRRLHVQVAKRHRAVVASRRFNRSLLVNYKWTTMVLGLILSAIFLASVPFWIKQLALRQDREKIEDIVKYLAEKGPKAEAADILKMLPTHMAGSTYKNSVGMDVWSLSMESKEHVVWLVLCDRKIVSFAAVADRLPRDVAKVYIMDCAHTK